MSNKQSNQINIVNYWKFRLGKGYCIGMDDKKALSDYAKSKNLTVKEVKRLM